MAGTSIIGHLQNILGQENIPYEATALNLIARAADGSMRDALSLTDQAIAYGGQTVNEVEVRAMLGAIDQSYLFQLLEALVANDGAALIAQAKRMEERSLSFEAALNDLAQLLHQIAVAQTVPESVATDLPERDALLSLAQKIPAETLQLYYQIALLGRRDIGLAPDEFAGFSMSLLRMLAFSPNESMVQPATSVATKPAPAQKKTELIAPAAEESAEIQKKQVEIVPIEHAIALTPRQSVAMASIAMAPAIDAPSSIESAHNPEIIRHQFNGNWRNLVDELKLGLARALAQHCELIAYDENSISLSVPEMQKHLLLPNYQDKLGSAIEQHFDKKIKLQFSIGGSGNTPAKQISHEKAQAQAGAETAIEQDEFVQALIQNFDATIIPNSIKPI